MDIIGKNITDSRNETGYGGFTIYGNAKDAKRLENSRGVKHQYLMLGRLKKREGRMTERPKRHVYINENTHVKYGETNEKQGFCLTCGQFSPCPHNALIDQYEAWEKKNPRLERLDE